MTVEELLGSFALVLVFALASTGFAISIVDVATRIRRRRLRGTVNLKRDGATVVWRQEVPEGTYVQLKIAGEDARPGTGLTLDEKVRVVAEWSSHLARLNSDIKDELTLQIAEVERLKAEADTAQEIAALNEKALQAAQSLAKSQLSVVLKENAKSDRRFQIVVAFVSFIAGVIATLVIQSIASG